MNRPLEHGDVCIIIDGLGGVKSPNLGKFVIIDKRVFGDYGMDHTKYGPVYHCLGKDLITLGDAGQYVATAAADLPGIWLRRVDPTALVKELKKVLEEYCQA